MPLVNLRFSKKLFLPNNVAYLLVLSALFKCVSSRMQEKMLARNRWLALICKADLAVAVSGGDSFSDIYGLGRFFYMSLPQILVTILGKRLLLLPQTIGPFKGRLSRLVAQFLMNRAEMIYSRDFEGVRESRKLLRQGIADSKVRFCYDMGFILEPRRPRDIDLIGLDQTRLGTKTLIGLNVSGLLYIGGYSGRNMFHLKVDYQELIQRMIGFLIEGKNANVLLVPHVFGDEAESDTVAVSTIFERLKDRYPDSLFCVNGLYDESEIKYIIGLCDFFIGSRMHACIAALSQSIPTVGIAYSQKFAGVLESIGTGHLVADPRQLTIEEILNIIDNVFAERKAIKSHLQEAMPKVRQDVLNVLAEVG